MMFSSRVHVFVAMDLIYTLQKPAARWLLSSIWLIVISTIVASLALPTIIAHVAYQCLGWLVIPVVVKSTLFVTGLIVSLALYVIDCLTCCCTQPSCDDTHLCIRETWKFVEFLFRAMSNDEWYPKFSGCLHCDENTLPPTSRLFFVVVESVVEWHNSVRSEWKLRDERRHMRELMQALMVEEEDIMRWLERRVPRDLSEVIATYGGAIWEHALKRVKVVCVIKGEAMV